MLAQISDGKLQLGGFLDSSKVDVNKYKEIISRFKQLDLGKRKFRKTGKANWDAIAKSIKGCDETALSYFKTLEDGNGTINNQSASIDGLVKQLKAENKSAGLAAAKTTLLNTALNAGIFLVASLAIQGIVNTFNNYIHRVENARERTAELFDEFKEMNDTLADHKKTVAELADRYDELSKGVNLSNNKNISLSADDYEEFLNMNEQLADSFPELTKGIDDNGNSILTLGTKGITAREQLEDLLKTEEDLNNFRIAQGLEDAFKGVYTYIEDADKAANTLNDSLSSANESIEALRELSENGIDLQHTELVTRGSGRSIRRENFIYSGDHRNKADRNYINILKASANDFFETLSDERRASLNGRYALNPQNLFDIQTDSSDGTFEIYARLLELTDDEIASLQSIIEDNISSATFKMNDEIDDQLQQSQESIRKAENAWRDFIPGLVAGMKSKNTFNDLDADLQDIAIKIVEGLDTSYAAAMDAYDPDPYAYIRDKLIVPMSQLSDADKKDVQDAFARLMTLDANDISDKNTNEINELAQKITDILGLDFLDIKVALGFDGDDVKTRLQNSIRQITDDHGLSDREEYADLSEYTKDFTAAQAELWLEATLGAENATQAVEMYEAALAAAKDVAEHSSPLSISEAVDRIDTRLRPALSSLQSAYQEIFAFDENTGEKIFTPLDKADVTDKFKPVLDALRDLDKIDGINIDYSAYDDFITVLSDTSSEADEVQEKFNKLAAYIINVSDCTDMSAESFNLLAESLTEMGVTNAYGILGKIRDAQEELAELTYDADTATIEETKSLFELGIASVETQEYLRQYLLQKELAKNPLSTFEDVMELENLCNALEITGEMYEAVNSLKAAFESKERGNHSEGIEEAIKTYQQKVQELANGYGYEYFKFNFDKSETGPSRSGSSSAKDTAETFDWVGQAINHVEKEIEALDKVANSAYSTFSQKNEALAQEIGKISEEIGLQQQAYTNYLKQAEAVGLSDHYKNLVQNGSLAMEDITDEALQNRISEYQKWYDKAQDVSKAIKDLNTDMKDLYVSAYELQTGNLKERLDSNSITQKQYLDGLKEAYEKFYADLEDFAQQYHEAALEYLAEEKNYLNSVAGAAASLLDTEIDKIQEDAQSQEESIQKQIDLLEAKKQPLQDELDALEDKAKRESLILNLQKAQYELARSENQRAKLIYKDGQMVYSSDPAAIADAKKDVDDAMLEIQKQSIEGRINALDDEIHKYNDLIDQINHAADTQIDALEKIKRKWQEVTDQQEYVKNVTLLTDEFGTGAVTKILKGNDDDLLERWKSSYISTLAGMDMESQGYIGDMTGQLAALYDVDLSPLQSQFQNVTSSISDATGAIGKAASAVGIGSNAPTDRPDTEMRPVSNNSLSDSVTNLGMISNETLPDITSNMEEIAQTAANASIEVSHVTDAINDIPESKDVTISVHTVGNVSGGASSLISQSALMEGNVYASGTKCSEKGLALVGEEKPEVILTNDKKAFLAKQPTLLNMEGGETVFDGDATAKMLKARGFRPITADEFPLLKVFSSYSPDELRQKFAPGLISPARSAASSAIQNANHAINHSSINNGPSYTMSGDVHIHCPGVTKDEVAKQIGAELNNVFSGLSLKAYQRANITR